MANNYTQKMMDNDLAFLGQFLGEEELEKHAARLQAKVGKKIQNDSSKIEKKKEEDIWEGWNKYLRSREKELRNRYNNDSYDDDYNDYFDIEQEIDELTPEWREDFLRHKER